MKENQKEKQKMQLLLEQYNLSRPVAPEIRKRMSDDLGAVFSEVAQKTSRPSIIAGLIVALYFIIKKTGIPLTIAKITAAMVITIPVVTGIYIVTSHNPSEQAPLPVFTVTIKPFTSSSLNPAITGDATRELQNILNRKNGHSFSCIARNNIITDTTWALFGSIEKHESLIHIIIKIIHVKTSRMIFITEEQLTSLDDMNMALEKISRRIPSLKVK